MINKYELKARVYPSTITLLPIVIVGLYFSIDYQNVYSLIGGLGLTTILTFVLGQLGRDRGKKSEKGLWKEWDGTPTTQILRYSNKTLTKYLKKDIHAKMANSTGIGSEDMKSLERKNPEKADDIYETWCHKLRSLTRDTTKYKLLFNENINYGFRRNLWGLKAPALVFIAVGVIIILLSEYYSNGLEFNLTSAAVISLSLLGVLLIFWVFIVKKSWIKTVAFAYAKRLVESYNTV